MSLDDHDIGIIKGMLARGDKQHDIAAYFATNGGRVGEISTGARGGDVKAVHQGLPPAGPPVEHARYSLQQAEFWITRAKEFLE